MDLLQNAYSNNSNSDEDELENFKQVQRKRVIFRSENISKKMIKSSSSSSLKTDNKQEVLFVPGRYISKRERALIASESTVSDSSQSSMVITTSSPVVGSILDSDIRADIASSLRSHGKGNPQIGRTPAKLSTVLNSHSKAVSAIQWSPTHGHLLASAGMDSVVYVWNVWSRGQRKARVFNYHSAAIKYLRWSLDGLSLLSCGYDCSSRLVDVETGIQRQTFKEDQIVGVLKFHPGNSNLFLSGGSKGHLRLWDVRVGTVVQEYMRKLGPILDIDFSVDAKQFVSSSDISKSNASENSIIVWDVLRQIPLSNQVYVEAYTCPCIKYHPFDPFFVAQSNGNYIAIFSSSPPFKLDKYKRYENHGVSGFPIKCDFSLDGGKLASGSSDGCIYLYNFRSSELFGKIKAYEQACVDVAFHPRIPNVIASCSWSGEVTVFE
ncbi:Wd repeat-containing protein [Thalictrum thalictroides]|uniref:Wd repeat-containing protein n=1 Tax=Thalictrum thalictroides TaxID=46969 RepID=A0A7J6X6S9_THATH|nr:Wd repeat-containing protein [Thalictrum thalictroides]